MEYVRGKNIFDYFHDIIPWEKTDVADNIFVQLLSAFDYMEKHAIIHRDIREGNILIDDEGNVKIIDFGLGKIFKPVTPSEDSMISIINRSGLDMLPEEYFYGKYDSKTDMFYIAELYNRILNKTNSKRYFTYDDILTRMMSVKASDRFATFEEILDIVDKKDFASMEISDEDRLVYQAFAESLANHIIEYTSERRFNDDIDTFVSILEENQRNNILEDYLQNNGDLIKSVVFCSFAYRTKKDINTLVVSDFLKWYKSLTKEFQQLVLNNIIYKLSHIRENLPDDIPY